MNKPASPAPGSGRLASIDWMRGIVMILMIIDHASLAYNSGRTASDSAAMYTAGDPLPAVQFFIRVMTHICAPVFLFLAGTALALSIERRVDRGECPRAIDRHIMVRGLIILVLDLTLISATSGRWTVQVLYAIGLAMILMAPLRRLSTTGLLVVGLGWFAFGELITSWCWDPSAGSASPAAALSVAVYLSSTLKIVYPVMPWLAMMVLGWVFGRYLTRYKASGGAGISPAAVLTVAGVVGVGVFLVVRGLNGYGNMFLYRGDDSWTQWLHVSKYPPSLAYAGLNLGLMCLGLAALIKLEPRVKARPNGVLLVYGQTAMIFYLVHRVVFEASATWCGLRGVGGLGATFVASALMLVMLYPICRWYRAHKRAHPGSLLRFF